MLELFKNATEINLKKGRWRYFIKVGFPLWWRDTKGVIKLIMSALLLLLIAAPIGFIIEKIEKRRKRCLK